MVRAILDTIPTERQEDFIREAIQPEVNGYAYQEVARHLPRGVGQEGILRSINEKGIGDKSDHAMKLVFGYDNGYDRAKTMALLSEERKQEAFGYFARRVANLTLKINDPYSHSHSDFEENERKRATYTNILFDLNEHLAPLAKDHLTLTDRSTLVNRGLAQVGDQLTWEGFCHVAAPCLDHERPALPGTSGTDVGQSNASQRGALLDRESLARKLDHARKRQTTEQFMDEIGMEMDFDDMVEISEMGMDFNDMRGIDAMRLAIDVLNDRISWPEWFGAPVPESAKTQDETPAQPARLTHRPH